MPWDETDQYIRSGHKSVGDPCRTITISDSQGIKAIYCKYGDKWAIQSYLFSKAKGWTMSKARAWFKSHKEQEESMHADFVRLYADFINMFGEEEGVKRYNDMMTAYGLDAEKSYASQLTRECLNGVCESFSWAKPLIQYLRTDEDAKYYKVRALTATLSMNANDYSDLAELERSARTLTWRPLNLNHDPMRMLPFPQNRVDWAEFEDKAVEAIIRIHNDQSNIQDKLDNGEIVNPSIEGEPRGGYQTEDGRRVPKWYNFTALALLEKDVTLPGVPTTYGFEPLFLNESLGRSLVESLSVEKEKEITTLTEQTDEYLWEEELGEAKWTRAYINDLPNSCFAVVEPCWKENKSARHLPYKTPDEIDLPHLRNALARMNQIKSVCDGSDEALRRKARAKLLPLAKKHLPNSQWAKEKTVKETLLEIQGISGMDVCYQCRFFESVPYTTETHPAATGEPTDAEVSVISGGVGPGVGRCRITSTLVTTMDPVCTAGLPRETMTPIEKPFESVGDLVLKAEIGELETQKLQLTQARNLEMEAHANTKKLLSEAQATIARKDSDLAVAQSKVSRLEKGRNDHIEKLDAATETIVTTQVKLDSLQSDLAFYKADVERKTEIVGGQKKEIAELKEEWARSKRTANEESAKRAEAMQRAEDAEEGRAETSRENALLSEDLSTARQTNYDLSHRLANQAKKIMKLERENREKRDAHRSVTEEYRELKDKYGKLKKEKVKKITVKT